MAWNRGRARGSGGAGCGSGAGHMAQAVQGTWRAPWGVRRAIRSELLELLRNIAEQPEIAEYTAVLSMAFKNRSYDRAIR